MVRGSTATNDSRGVRPAPPRPRAGPTTDPRPGNSRAPGVVQRYIAKDDHPKIVYMPDTVDTTGEFQASLRNLMGDHAVRKLTWGEFREIVWPGTLTVDRDNLPAWAAANLGRGLNQSDHQPVPMVDAVPAPDVLEVRRQFDDDMTVYHYAIGGNIAYGLPNSQSHLLKPYDMREAGDPLAHVLHTPSACVIQALDDFNVNVPGTHDHSTAAWHTYCRDHIPQIDYRTDSHYIRLYVGELHYRLKNNQVINWNNVNWNTLGGDGNYLVSTYPNGAPVGNVTGHMVGVVIHGGAVQTIHDRQNLTAPRLAGGNVFVRYIFKM